MSFILKGFLEVQQVNKSKRGKKDRFTKKVFKIFCEGDTEYNYFEEFRKDKKLSLKLEPIDMEGGGYTNFLSELRKDGNSNCLAKFIIIDGDRAQSDSTEQENLIKLIDYCKIQNDSKRIPHILIINYPDFEYVACLHSGNYKGMDTKSFIKAEYKYKNVDQFKADKNVYYFLNSNGRCYKIMLDSINKKTAVINNKINITKKSYEITVALSHNMDNLGIKGCNIDDLFSTLMAFEPTV